MQAVLFYTEILARKVALWVFSLKWNEWKNPQFNFPCQNFNLEHFFFKSEDKYLSTTSLSFTRVLKNHVWIRSTYFSLKNIFLIFKKICARNATTIFIFHQTFLNCDQIKTRQLHSFCTNFSNIFLRYILYTYTILCKRTDVHFIS